MSGLFGGGQTTTPDYTGLQIQTAVNTLPIPIVWGESKVAPNVIWYNNFQIGGGGKGGGKGGMFSGGNQTTYTAAVMLALCEGPIANINQVWKNQSVYSAGQLGLSLFTGTDATERMELHRDRVPLAGAGLPGHGLCLRIGL